jgi:hypothetical protein
LLAESHGDELVAGRKPAAGLHSVYLSTTTPTRISSSFSTTMVTRKKKI